MACSSDGFMSLSLFSLWFLSFPSFFSEISSAPVSSVFSMFWDNLFGIRFRSVPICLVRARPGEFDPAGKLNPTFYKNVSVTFFLLFFFAYWDFSYDKALMLSLANFLLLFLNYLKIT